MRGCSSACGHGRGKYDPAPGNPRVSAQMKTQPPEVIIVDTHRISCDGEGGGLGHPRVFLEMGTATEVECPYCDRKFVLSKQAAEAGHH